MKRWQVFGLVALCAAAVLLLLGAYTLRTDTARAWMWRITGEESAWEGTKGTVAAILLRYRGEQLDLAPDDPVAHLGVNPYGVNTFLQLEADPEMVRRSSAAMRDAGIGWSRQQFPWEDIEIHGPGDFEDRRHDPPRSAWDKYDRIVDTLHDHGVELLVRLDDPPEWAYDEEGPVTHKGPPADLNDYGNFVAAVAERYCGKVRYYQIWNEPNIYPEWGDADVDPAGYAELLSLASERARQACPDVVIVSAALAQTTEPGGRNMHDLRYLQALYDAGWQDDFDVLGAQAFGLWTGPTDQRVSEDRANFARIQLVRDIMVRSGDADKPVWVTEFGWDSPPLDMDAPYGRVQEDRRAEYTTQAYERIDEEWPWIGVSFLWFLRRPNREWHERPEGWFRILEPEWGETPTYTAMAELGAKPAVLGRGRHGADHRALQYSGFWRDVASGDGNVVALLGERGDEVQFAFRGDGASVIFDAPEADRAEPEVFAVIDGRNMNSALATRDDGSLALTLDDLDTGEHQLIMRVDDGTAVLREILVTAPGVVSPVDQLMQRVAAVLVLLAMAVAALLIMLWWLRKRLRGTKPSQPSDAPADGAAGGDSESDETNSHDSAEPDAGATGSLPVGDTADGQSGNEDGQASTAEVQTGTEDVQTGTEHVQTGTEHGPTGTEHGPTGTEHGQTGTEHGQTGTQGESASGAPPDDSGNNPLNA